MKAMLAETGRVDEVTRYLEDDEWVLEQKLDGDRMLVVCGNDGSVQFLNRKGDPKTSVPAYVRQIGETLARVRAGRGGMVLDGELLEGGYVLYDLPYLEGRVHVNKTWEQRRAVLEELFLPWPVLPVARGAEAKKHLWERLMEAAAEGAMAKHVAGRYRQGIHSDAWLKLKLVKTADLVITKMRPEPPHESFEVAAWRDGELVDVGRVTIEKTVQRRQGFSLDEEWERFERGERGPLVVEVRYLYLAARDRLYQAHWNSLRDDKLSEECTWDQLVPTNRAVVAH